MTYNSIPLPSFPFTVVPEQEAEEIVTYFFSSNTSFHIDIDIVKNEVNNKLYSQDNNDDCIVILSYLINKATERVSTENDKYVLEFYTQVLHFLYRKIQTYGISIPNDIFDQEGYKRAQIILEKISLILNDLKGKSPEKEIEISNIQEDVKKAGKKFLYLGKEDWAKMVLGAVITSCIKEGIVPVMPAILNAIGEIFSGFVGLLNSKK